MAALCGPTFVAMMQSADFPDLNDPASLEILSMANSKLR
jgi:hypothetical protein